MASPTRCAQPECIAGRQETELLRRDLQEMEREVEQLHEQLARKESECGALALQLQQQQSEEQQRDALKDQEIARLSGVVKEMNDTVRRLQQDATREQGTRREAPASGPDTVALQEDVETLRGENEELRKAVKELRAVVARETSASAHANQQVAAIAHETKDKRDALYEALKENEMLRRERQERDEALEKVSQLALDYEIALKVLHDQQRDYLEALDELKVDNAQQRTLIDQLEREKGELEAKLIEMDEHESDVDAVVKQLSMKHDMEKAVLRAELAELQKKIAEGELRQKASQGGQKQSGERSVANTRAEAVTAGQLEELERQLEMLHDLRVRDQVQLEEKDLEIRQLRSDLESLAEHLQGGGMETQQAVQLAVEAESRKHKVNVQENAALKRRLKEQGELVEQLEFRQSQLERDLLEAQEWNAKYEAGAGLEDVMKFQKKLRKELEKQQLANQRLRQELNDQRDATGKLHVAFERLKTEVGKPSEFEYDDLIIENHLKGELAVQQAVLEQMEHQIHEMENERVRLLQKLRQQARMVGGKLYEVHGLTTEQWQQVEEFIDRVKLTPEVAKRWLANAATSAPDHPDTTSAKENHERDAAMKRLQSENDRLRAELEDAVRRVVVDESTSTARSEVDTAEKKHASTSPLKATKAEKHGERMDQDAPEETARARPLSDPEKNKNTNTSVADDDGVKDADRSRGSTSSPEELAQAIAAALESRLAQLHAISDRQPPQQLRSTHSVATQPSPSKAGAPSLENTSLAFDSDDEMSHQIDFLKEFQLLLDDYVKLEGQNALLQDQLNRHESAYKSLMDQQSVTYQHFFHLQDSFTTEKSKLQYDLQQLRLQNQELQTKCQRYEATLHTLSSETRSENEDALRLRSEVIELTRRVAHDEVSFAKLKREHGLLQEEYRMCLADVQGLEEDWLEMERVLKFRILYLESWKGGAEEMLKRMEATLDNCVLKSIADKTQKDYEMLLAKYSKVSEEFVDLHSKYLRLYELPIQMSRLQHENAVLVAERAARQEDGKFVSLDALAQSRIAQLQEELQQQLHMVQELAAKLKDAVVVPTIDTSSPTSQVDRMQALESENILLSERISEVEQLYESLVREHAKAKQDAELAASQAHTLSRRMTQEKAKREDTQDQLRDLMSATEDHSILARLQQQLIHMKSNYQQFLLKYDNAVAAQQDVTLKNRQLELQLENQAKAEHEARAKAREQLVAYGNAIDKFKERDYMMRNTKWDAFKKRLDGLEDEMRVEQDRRRALEKELEEKQAELPFVHQGPGGPSAASVAETSRLKSRIDALETRERVLIGQLEVLAKNSSRSDPGARAQEEERQKKEVAELKRVHGEMLRQVQALQSRNAELLQLNNEVETQRRAVQRQKEDLEIEYQQLHAQWQLHGGKRRENNQAGSPSSPLMRKKVGLYEKDHVEQQQAAQASIASLKQLLAEKNAVIEDYQKKITAIRAEVAASKAQERADATQLHKKLYEENQKMISQLKEATDRIHHLEKTGSDKKALKAAQDRHELALQEWKRVEVELESAKLRSREMEMEIQALRNERDIAEARAGEALEEIVLNQEKIKSLEKAKKSVEDQLVFIKRDIVKREEKMQLLREAIIKLKEEFLKAEDRHAIELAKAQNAIRTTSKQTKTDTEREREQWKDERDQLEAQVQMLQEKLALAKKAEAKAKAEKAKVLKQSEKNTKGADKRNDSDGTGGEHSSSVLHAEIERLKGALKDRVVGETRIVEELEKKIKVLQAQNLALRESAASGSVGSDRMPDGAATRNEDATQQSGAGLTRREQWEAEKRLQRRVDVMTMRMKEKQTALDRSEKECEQLRGRLIDAESKLREMQRAATSARDAMQGGSGSTLRPPASQKAAADVVELERQNAFLQETLVLKRKDWEDSFQRQMEKYEAQLLRLRNRLAQRSDKDTADMSTLEREERDFVATHDLKDELLALGGEMREKERLLIEKDTRIMELELELEAVRIEYQRLNRKMATSHQAQAPTLSSGGRRAAGSRLKSTAQERMELEEVIENMKKVIEKLRVENEKLRKATSVSPDKVDALRRKLKDARDAGQALQEEVNHLRQETVDLKKDKLRLQQRVRLLSSSSAAVNERRSSDALADAEALHKLQLKEKDDVQQRLEEQISELKERVSHKDAMIRELNVRLTQETAQGDTGDQIKQFQAQLETLESENEQLRQELSAFDQDFFEEIEDLKYKYAQAVRDKQQLERALHGTGLSP